MKLTDLSGITVEVMLKDPVCWPADRPADVQLMSGPGATEWSPLEVRPEVDCDHGETVCLECIESWACDYYVSLTSPAAPGARLGLNDVPGLESL